MTRAMCPAGCGAKFISKEHAEAHADENHPDWKTPKSKGWATPYGFIDFREPVTYEEACSIMLDIARRHERTDLRRNA